MTTCNSLQELGELFGRGASSCSPSGSGEATHYEVDCNGRIYMVDDRLVGISTSAWGHPGILCRWINNAGLFSMGRDLKKLNYKDRSNYFKVDPTQENGLRKPTGFERSLTRISEASLAPLSILGYLDRRDCQTCVGKTLLQRARNR